VGGAGEDGEAGEVAARYEAATDWFIKPAGGIGLGCAVEGLCLLLDLLERESALSCRCASPYFGLGSPRAGEMAFRVWTECTIPTSKRSERPR
jgi:hypothetical protein